MPEGKKIIQNLHHVFNLGVTRAYLTVGDSHKLLGTVELNFGVRVQAAYGAVLKHCYDLVYSWAYQPGEEMPEIPNEVFKAFGGKKLSHLNMSEEAFCCFFAFWQKINIREIQPG